MVSGVDVEGISLEEASRLMTMAFTKGDRIAVTYDGETHVRTVADVSRPDDEDTVTLTFEAAP